jgi:ABC-type polysaccharide/polyol phosphate transport system ATPase subunit
MIRVRNLKKVYKTRFGENRVFEDISFDLAMGEKLGILGRNGAGKSTLVRLISGAERPTAGSIEADMSVSWPIAFGGAFQPNLTGLDNIRFISRIYDQDIEANLAFVEDFAELGPYLGEEVRTYSSGMRARLAFAISMIIEFDCFLIDEVGAVGDARFHDRCNYELFRKRADRAMIIISHDASYIRDHCNRFAVLHDGVLVQFDDFDEAYHDFREKIGLERKQRSETVDIADDRRQLIETTHTVSVLDDAFRVTVQDADWKRDEGDWAAAEAGYAEALALYPYQRSYWVQRAHMAKEQGEDVRAEIGYRTAIALGEAYADVREHLEFVMRRQGTELADYSAHIYAGDDARRDAPAAPDIALFARGAWGSDTVEDETMLHLLRTSATCDEALAAMLARPVSSGTAGEIAPSTIAQMIAIACPHLDRRAKAELAASEAMRSDLWGALVAAGGFADWQATQAAMKAPA